MNEITLEITDFCPHECEYCSTSAGPDGCEYVSLEKVSEILAKFGGVGKPAYDRINISGGEPLAHPQFYEILRECHKYLIGGGRIVIYTNAIQAIAYNANVIHGVEVISNIPVRGDVDEIHALKMVRQGREAKRPEVHLSSNWTGENCSDCKHPVMRPDGTVAEAPCKKE